MSGLIQIKMADLYKKRNENLIESKLYKNLEDISKIPSWIYILENIYYEFSQKNLKETKNYRNNKW